MTQQDRSTHDAKGKKTGSVSFGGKDIPTVSGLSDLPELSDGQGGTLRRLEANEGENAEVFAKRLKQYNETLVLQLKDRVQEAADELGEAWKLKQTGESVPTVELTLHLSEALKALQCAEESLDTSLPRRRMNPVNKRYEMHYSTPLAQWRAELIDAEYDQKAKVFEGAYGQNLLASMRSTREATKALRVSLKEKEDELWAFNNAQKSSLAVFDRAMEPLRAECQVAITALEAEIPSHTNIIAVDFNNNMYFLQKAYRSAQEELDHEIAMAGPERFAQILKERDESYDADIDEWFTTIIARVDARRAGLHTEGNRDEEIFQELKDSAKRAYNSHLISNAISELALMKNDLEYNLVHALATQDAARVFIAEASESQAKVYLQCKRSGRPLTTGSLPTLDVQWNNREAK